MAKKKHSTAIRIPTTKRKDQIRIDYRKSLGAKDVSGTSETDEPQDTESTGYVAPTETIQSPPSVTTTFDWSKWISIAKIVGAIIAAIVFVGTIIYKYVVLEISVGDLQKRVTTIEGKIENAHDSEIN